MKIGVATCYCPVDADIGRNARYVRSEQRVATKRHAADVAHFPEACLSGYAAADFKSYRRFNWPLLEASTRQVVDLARELNICVLVGSTHLLTGQHKPHDNVYVMGPRGTIVERYDKRFCSNEDLAHYSPGAEADKIEQGRELSRDLHADLHAGRRWRQARFSPT